MLRMMAIENLAEWQWTGWIEVETVRATIDAYERGFINLPEVPRDTQKGLIRYVCEPVRTRSYTMGTVAEFLGWTNKAAHGNGVRPNHGCEVAFMAIDALKEGLVKEADLIGLDRGHIQEVIRGMRRIANVEKEEARRQREQAESSQRRAAEAKPASGPLAPAP
jgi:hypothetical protein